MEKEKDLPNVNYDDDGGIGGAHCPFWFMGDETSAKKDLKKVFEISDEKDTDK